MPALKRTLLACLAIVGIGSPFTPAPSAQEVTVKVGKAKAGSWLKKSAAKGTVSFSVSLNAATRKALRAKHRLRLSVAVALTPPGGKPLTKTAKATVSL